MMVDKLRSRFHKQSKWFCVFGVISLLGLLLRARQFFTGRSLWLDEAFLAVNIVNRNFGELLQPLDFSQGAPIGFLWLQKLLVLIGGESEYVFRLVPFVSGVLAFALFLYIIQKILPRGASLLAAFMFAISNFLIYYASEAKQYSSDVLASLLGIFILFYLVEEDTLNFRLVLIGLLGGALLWFSHPVIFVLTAVGLTAIYASYASGEYGKIVRIFIITAIWAVSFGLLYIISLNQLSQHKVLLNFWRGNFPPAITQPRLVGNWLWQQFIVLFKDPMGLTQAKLGLTFYAIGAISLWYRDKRYFGTLLLPLIFALGASFLHRYPFGNRLLLFLVPLILIVLAEGIYFLLILNTKLAPILGFAVMGFLLYQPVVQAMENFNDPNMGEDIAPILQYVYENWQEGDIIYVYYASSAPFEYYLFRYPFAEDVYVYGVKSREDWSVYIPQLDELAARYDRIWLVFTHVYSDGVMTEEEFMLEHFYQKGGLNLDSQFAANASVYLYEFGERR